MLQSYLNAAANCYCNDLPQEHNPPNCPPIS